MKEKKNFKRVIAILLMMILVIVTISGCKNSEEANGKQKSKTMGRYVEEELILPEKFSNGQLLNLVKNVNGDIEVFLFNMENNKYLKLTRNESGGWDEKEQPWLSNIKTEDYNWITNIVYGEDGLYYALVQVYDDTSSGNLIFKCQDENGDPIKVNIPILEKDNDYNGIVRKPIIDNIGVLKNGTIVAYDAMKRQISMFSGDTGESLIELDSVVPFTQREETLWATKSEDKTIVRHSDADTEIPTESNVIDGNLAVTDKAIYLINKEGIHRLENNGTIWQTVVDGSLTSLSIPQSKYISLEVSEKDKEEYYVMLDNADQLKKIYHYYFDESIPSVPDKEITVYSLYENSTIRQAINKFQGTNSNVKVNYQVALGEDSSATINDTIRALNTELLMVMELIY